MEDNNNNNISEDMFEGLEPYIGTKIIKAKEMYDNTFQKTILGKSDNEIHNQESRGEGYLVVYPDGYKSWSPKEVFDNAYRKISEAEQELII